MNLQELKQLLETIESIKGISRSLMYNNELKKELESKFLFLLDCYQFNIQQWLYHLKYNLDDFQRCECGSIKQFLGYGKDGYHKTCKTKLCTDTLRLANIKKTTIEKYGVEHTSQLESTKKKSEETNMKRHGVKHNWIGHMRESGYNTMQEKYGFRHALQSESINEKRSVTCKERHNTLDFLHSEKALQTNEIRYGNRNIMLNKDIVNKVSKTHRENALNKIVNKLKDKNLTHIKCIENNRDLLCCDICKKKFDLNRTVLNARLRFIGNICIYCNPIKKWYSIKERELQNIYTDLTNNEVSLNIKKYGYELDLHDKVSNIALEFNGLYWHSEIYKNPNYHQKKNGKFLEKGIRIYHIWEDDYEYKKDIVLGRIKNLLGLNEKIYARKTIVKSITSKESQEFLDKNHIQGNVNARYKYGLFYNDELVSVMTFSKERKKNAQDYEYELIRFSTKIGYTVIGGSSKLFQYFIKEVNPKQIITYADASFSADPYNTVYIKIGFNYEYTTDPDYYWVVDGKRVNRQNFTKKKLIELGADSNLTEVEIMHSKKSYRVFGCGNHRYLWKPKS